MRYLIDLFAWLFGLIAKIWLRNRRLNSLRVMAWNLGERVNEELPHFVGLIKSADPDIVCLNECRRNAGYDQIEQIARMAGYNYFYSEAISNSNAFGRRTEKTIGVISRIPISNMFMLPANWSGSPIAVLAKDGPYCDMEVSFTYMGIKHFLYSVRHSAYSLAMNRESLLWLEERIRLQKSVARNAGEPAPYFILAGDFNSPGAASGEPSRQAGFMTARPQPQHMLSFFTQTNLIDATQNLFGFEKWNGVDRPVCMVDVIAYDGEYDVLKTSTTMFGRSLSDHNFVFADFATKARQYKQLLDLPVYYPPPFDFSNGRTQSIISYDVADNITATLVNSNWADPFCTVQLEVNQNITWRKELAIFSKDDVKLATLVTDGATKTSGTFRFLYADRSGMYLTLSKAEGSWFSVNPAVEKVRIYLESMEKGSILFKWNRD